MAEVTVSVQNASKPAPRWFRKFKKIFSNLENATIIVLMARGFAADSFVLLLIKVGTSTVLENMETILANGEEYKPADK